ncbi:MAG: glutamyl-tRNA reductase [Armatimonadota bacterium]
MTLSTIGLSHKTAAVEVRERLAFGEAEIPSAVVQLRDITAIDECVLLSTCNRTELYLVARGDPPVRDAVAFLSGSRGLPADAFESALYVHRDMAAARHALRVTAGLDSMIVGEQQILGQVRRAFDVARTAKVTGPALNRLMQLALATGRRVRRETGLIRSAPSVPRAALAQSRRILASVSGRRVIVVGAGELAALVVKVFAAAGAQITAVANRTPEGAAVLARRVGAESLSLDEISAAATGADILVICIGAAEPIILKGMLDDARHGDPLVVIDLGVPRGVDAAVASLPGVRLIDLDGLSGVDPGPPITGESLMQAERIVADTLGGFERWMASRDAVPLIAALRGRAQSILEREFARARSRLRGLDDGGQEAARALAEAVVRKLLHAPIVRLRESAARHDADSLRLARELFDLDVDPAESTDGSDPGEDA